MQVLRFQYGSQSKGYAWYMLFVLLWTSQFIIALGQITMALAFSTWYGWHTSHDNHHHSPRHDKPQNPYQ